MLAFGYSKAGPLSETDALQQIEMERLAPEDHDIEVAVAAISINPVDVKLRAGAQPKDGARILGWDAAGTVLACGDKVRNFKPGDKVYYAGALNRPGSYSQYQLVDERIAAPMPASLDFDAAAALPLTAITAWEALFHRMDVSRPVPGAANAVLIIGGAGGVGSIAIQLVKKRTDALVIATASRPESKAWVEEMGADYIIDHSKPMAPQIAALGIGEPGYVLSTNNTDKNAADIAELIAPQGHLCLIDDPEALNIMPFKMKSVAIHWEFMFTRSMLQTADIEEQNVLLTELSRLIDAGEIVTTVNKKLSPINTQNLLKAHEDVESSQMIGKLVLSDWQ